MSKRFLSESWFKVAKLRPRLRDHARVVRHRYRGSVWFVIDDGAARKSHRLSWGAYLLVGKLDGSRTVDDVWNELVAELDEDAPTQDEVIHTLHQLHDADLLLAGPMPDTGEAVQRQRKHRASLWLQNLKSPMSLRIPLIDPDRFITRLMPFVRPFFGLTGGLIWLAIVLPALFLAGENWDELSMGAFDRIIAVDNLVLMSLCYPFVKIIHELGHGFAAKANGREVREMGVMLLVFFPVPYVDVSGASALRSKMQRALIGAAGMLSELVLAAIAMYIWVLVEPGLLRAVCFNVMVIGSVSTLLVNGNPLLRFDGYYILADLIEIPNFGQRSNRYWSHLIDRHIFRTHGVQPFAATPGEKRWFFFYAPAAFVMRMMMLFSIALIAAKRFFFLGVLIALWSLWSGVAVPIYKMGNHVIRSPHLHSNRRRAMQWTGGALAALLVILFLLPAPHHTATQGVVWLPEDAHVRAGFDGVVTRLDAREGTLVHKGQRLLEAQRPAQTATVDALAWRVRELEATTERDMTENRVDTQISQVQLAEARDHFEVEKQRLGDLDVAAGADGTFLLAGTPAEDIPGRYYKKGDLIGYVAPDHADRARVVVGQDDIGLVRRDVHAVSLKLANMPTRTFDSHIIREVPGGRSELPSAALAASNGGLFATDPSDAKGRKSLHRIFQVDVELPPELRNVPFGTRVYVRFRHDPEPLGWQIARRVRQLFLAQFNA